VIVGSVISGVFLLADQPYEIGDMIELADRNQRGFVDDITLRYTKVFTLDNTFLVIPNGTIRVGTARYPDGSAPGRGRGFRAAPDEGRPDPGSEGSRPGTGDRTG